MLQTPQAVIEIGSTGLRLLVAELPSAEQNTHRVTVLDRSEFPINIGRDVFTFGSISTGTQSSCVQIMNRYAEQLKAWGISKDETFVIGTSAVREAVNRDPFVDRIKVRTGFTVRVIDGIEENRLRYIAVTECLKEVSSRFQNADTVILEISGGSTEMMLLEKGRIAVAHSMRLGTIIIEQQIYALAASLSDEQKAEDGRRFLKDYIRNARSQLNSELNLNQVAQFIAVGHDMSIAALFCGTAISPFLWEIQRQDFLDFVDKIQQYSMDEIIGRFHLSYSDAQTFQLSLSAYKEFVKVTSVSSLVVPETSIREGLLISRSSKEDENLQKEFDAQIIAGATTLLRKYQGDEKHADFVREISLKIYDCLESELGMTRHERLLLEISAILHDIGMFIRPRDHNLHSHYIISQSEIFGLSREDIGIVAQIAGYHRGQKIPQDDSEFKLQPRAIRLTILKLTAILRLADAMDRSHRQKFPDCTVSLGKDTLTLQVNTVDNLRLEKIAINEKCEMFENVFGYKVVLV